MVAGEGLLTRENQARLSRLLPQALRQNLVHANAAMKHCATTKRGSREDTAGHAGVNPDACRGLVKEPADHIELGLERLQRRQALGQLHLSALALGSPVVGADSRSHELNHKALGRSSRIFLCAP